MPTLYIYPEPGEALRYALTSSRVIIGRAADNDIVLSDQFSSGHHAAVYPTGDGYSVADQGSKNGTLLNGRPISTETPLEKGDEIRIGTTRIFFDQELSPGVNLVEDPPFSANSRRLLRIEDILKQPASAGVEPGAAPDSAPDRLRQEQKIIATLSEASQALISQMTMEDLLEEIMDLIAQNIPMDRGVLMLKEGKLGALVPKVVRIHDPLLSTQSVVVSRTILQTALEQNSAILISDIHSDQRLREQESIVATHSHSAMCVPLWNNREIIGAIYSDRITLPQSFAEEDLRLLAVLANLAALKIENVRLFEDSRQKVRMEQELITAERIQRNFLPKEDPVLPSYEISGNMWPCHHIGGDYFDFIPMGPGKLGLAIADVSGHGVSAALLMASLRSWLRALIAGTIDLAALAGRLNSAVLIESDGSSFISFFFAILDGATGLVAYVNAGHNPPVLLKRSGMVQALDSTGLCLGMFPFATYQTQTITTDPGDILCLFTDGIIEGRNSEDEEFGTERLAARLGACSSLRVREILKEMHDAVSSFTSTPDPADDMTLVILKNQLSAATELTKNLP
jgi:sigma-B regulation protein RsbU (phosphoserine phosphatase)